MSPVISQQTFTLRVSFLLASINTSAAQVLRNMRIIQVSIMSFAAFPSHSREQSLEVLASDGQLPVDPVAPQHDSSPREDLYALPDSHSHRHHMCPSTGGYHGIQLIIIASLTVRNTTACNLTINIYR